MKRYKKNVVRDLVFISVLVTMENVTKLIQVLKKIETFVESCDIPQLKNNVTYKLSSPYHQDSYLEITTNGLNRVQKRLLSEAVYKFYQVEQPFYSYSFFSDKDDQVYRFNIIF
jgi:alpha-galactosidase